MKLPRLPTLWLRLRLALGGINPVALAAACLLLAGAAWHAWLWQAKQLLQREQALARAMAPLARPAEKPVPVSAQAGNLALFYGALGERRHAEQQVRTLFALAEKSGLSLTQGEYREGATRDPGTLTYQVTLPIKGSYGAIWDFALQALVAIPFASLDDISFKRDGIGDAAVEARLRFTLYLSAANARGRP